MSLPDFLDETLCVRLVQTLGHFLWQGVAIYLLLWFATFLMGRSPSYTRYTVSLLALMLMVLCPAVTFMLIGQDDNAMAVTPTGSFDPIQQASIDTATVVTPALSIDDRPPMVLPYPQAVSDPDSAPAVEAKPPATPAQERTAFVDWRQYAPHAAIVYLAGVMVMLARLLFALQGGRRLRRRSQPVDNPRLLAAMARQAKAIGLSFTPAIGYCRQIVVPTVIGVLRPMILLPISLSTGLSAEQIEILLAHELAHIRRYDYLVNILQRLIEAILFFHPCVWLISRRIRLEREHCCDDLVLAGGIEDVTYADSLVQMAEIAFTSCTSRPLAAMAGLSAADRPSQLRQRILRMIEHPVRKPIRLAPGSNFALILVGLAATLAIVQFAVSGGLKNNPIADETASDASAASDSAFKVTLPSGTEVELIGVANHPSQGGPWWKPDGSPLDKAPYYTTTGNTDPDDQDRGYEFAFRFKSAVDPDCHVRLKIEKSSYSGGTAKTKDGQSIDDIKTWSASIAADKQSQDIGFGVAEGPWETIMTTSKSHGSAEGKNGIHVAMTRAYQAEGGTVVTVTDNRQDLDRRLVAVDLDGKIHETRQRGSYGFGDFCQSTFTFFHLAPDEIKEFQFQFRPVQWVWFRNVSLRPGRVTEAKVEVEPVPSISDEPVTLASAKPDAGEQSSFEAEQYDVVRERWKALAMEAARLEMEQLQLKVTFDNLKDLDPAVAVLTPQMAQMVDNDSQVIQLKNQLQLTRQKLIELQTGGGNLQSPEIKRTVHQVELYQKMLDDLLAEKRQEVRKQQLASAETAWLNALQAQIQIQERDEDVRAKLYSLDQHARKMQDKPSPDIAIVGTVAAKPSLPITMPSRTQRFDVDSELSIYKGQLLSLRQRRSEAVERVGPDHETVQLIDEQIAEIQDYLNRLQGYKQITQQDGAFEAEQYEVLRKRWQQLAEESTRLETQELQLKIAYDNQRVRPGSTELTGLPTDSDIEQIVSQYPEVSALRQQLMSLQETRTGMIGSRDKDHPSRKAVEAEIETLNKRLESLLASKRKQARDLKINAAEMAYMNAAQALSEMKRRTDQARAELQILAKQMQDKRKPEKETAESFPTTMPSAQGQAARGTVYIVGDVKRPGVYVLTDDQNLTMMKLINSAGGYDGGDYEHASITLLRDGVDGKRHTALSIGLKTLTENEEESDVFLLNGDQVQLSNEPPKSLYRPRHSVTLVVGKDRMTFQGKDVMTWSASLVTDPLEPMLKAVPDRPYTVFCIAMATNDVPTAGQFSDAERKAGEIVDQYGFEYLSFVGSQPLGTLGAPTHYIPVESVSVGDGLLHTHTADPPGRPRYAVCLVVGADKMTLQGQDISNWRVLENKLWEVPNRYQTVFEIAIASDSPPGDKFHEAEAQAGELQKKCGFEYLSYTGSKPLGSMGTTTHYVPVEDTKGAPQHTVHIVIGVDSLTFDGKRTNWQELAKQLEKVPDRKNTAIQLSSMSPDLPATTLMDAQHRVRQLTNQYGFARYSDSPEMP